MQHGLQGLLDKSWIAVSGVIGFPSPPRHDCRHVNAPSSPHASGGQARIGPEPLGCCPLTKSLVRWKDSPQHGWSAGAGSPQVHSCTDAAPDGSMTACAARLFASTNKIWMGSRSGPTSAWPGIGSIHPAWVGDDEPLDVRPVRSIAAKERGFSKPCVESWVTRSATS